jgi:hypothetical protein
MGRSRLYICNIHLESYCERISTKFVIGIFGPKRDEVTAEWRKLHNEELCDLYSSPTIVRVIKLRRMRWADM